MFEIGDELTGVLTNLKMLRNEKLNMISSWPRIIYDLLHPSVSIVVANNETTLAYIPGARCLSS